MRARRIESAVVGLDLLPEFTRGAALAFLAVALVSSPFALPAAARASFEIRDTSPAALGAASMDLEAPRFFDSGHDSRGGIARVAAGLRFEASHATLYGIEGLSGDRVAVEAGSRSLEVALSLEQVGGLGALEQTVRAAVRERTKRPVSLQAIVERLGVAVDGEPRAGGWTLGGAAEAALPLAPVRLELRLAADRMLRSSALDRMGVGPSLAVGLRVRAAVGSVALLDRWEGNGRRSPRLFVEVPLGSAALIRFARGESPSRTGAALAVRVGRLDAAAGRLDLAWGDAITGLSLGLLPAPMRWREP